jgi:hypothetical protein
VRVAVLMSGELRTLWRLEPLHAQWLERLRAHYDVDLFVHSWGAREAPRGRLGRNQQALLNLGPQETVIEPQPALDVADVFVASTSRAGVDDRRAKNFALMWASLERCFELARARERDFGSPYDLVVRTRPDLLWDVPSEVARCLASGRSRLPRRLASIVTPSDVAAVTTRSDASVLFRLYSAIPDFKPDYEGYGYRSFVAEFALGFYLKRVDVSWDGFASDLVLLRESGKRIWFRQDAPNFAMQATRSLISDDGDALTMPPDRPFVSRLKIDIAANVGCEEAELNRLAELSATVHELMRRRDPGALSICLGGISRRPSRTLALEDVFVAGLAIEAYRASRARPIALAARVLRDPGSTVLVALVLLRVVGIRWRSSRRFESLIRRAGRHARTSPGVRVTRSATSDATAAVRGIGA